MEHTFRGKVITDTYPNAMLCAQTGSNSPFNLYHQSYFVDGSHSPAQTTSSHYRPAASGAGVAYKCHITGEFTQRSFPVPEGDALTAELTALAEGLEIALSETTRHRQENMSFYKELYKTRGEHKVFVFSDCKSSLELLQFCRQLTAYDNSAEKLCAQTKSGNTRSWYEADDAMLRRIISASHQLGAIRGVKVEVHWTPGHSGTMGNELADEAAKVARTTYSHPWYEKTKPAADVAPIKEEVETKLSEDLKARWLNFLTNGAKTINGCSESGGGGVFTTKLHSC